MRENNQYKSFTFKNHSENIHQTLDVVLAHISEMATGFHAPGLLISRVKWLIVELLTNTIKHSETDTLQLHIEYDGRQLIVQKEDHGKPLILKSCITDEQIGWPLQEKGTEKTIQIYMDAINQLHAIVDEQGHVGFHASETPCENRNNCIDSLSEHFGLLIITRSSDKFMYQYNETTGANVFRCYIDLDNITENNS